LRHRLGASLLLAIAATILTTAGVAAKLDATLSATEARAGDIVTLTTSPDSQGVSQGGQLVPVYVLVAIDPSMGPAFCNFWDATSAKNAGAVLVGSLSWDDTTGVGRLSFKIPGVPPGSHPIAVLAPNASPGCWPEATLTVLPTAQPATDTTSPLSAAQLSWLSLIGGGVGALAVGIWLRRRESVG
jgi:hypothetical protein